MITLMTRLPTNWSRTSTHAIAKPAIELTIATPNEQSTVSSSAATPSGSVTAFTNPIHPPLNAFSMTAANGNRTRRLR